MSESRVTAKAGADGGPSPAVKSSAYWSIVLAVTAAGVLVAVQYYGFWHSGRQRWDGLLHDRFGQYATGLKMALALSDGDLRTFISEVDKCKISPPLHTVMVAGSLWVGGSDFRLAAIPSSFGWFLTLFAGWLLARRMTAESQATVWGGLIAFMLIAASPAHKAYATDFMLESLGAGLTMLVLYLYLRARQPQSSASSWAILGLALSLLFTEKYNYWLLVVLALVLDSLLAFPFQYGAVLRQIIPDDWRSCMRRQALRPGSYLLLGLAGLVAFVRWNGPTSIPIAGQDVSLYPPNNLITITYVTLCLHLGIPLWRSRLQWWPRLPVAARQLLLWHGLFLTSWFLIPRRLGTFLWYVGPTHRGEMTPRPPWESAQFYLESAFQEYHSQSLVFGAVILAVFITLWASSRLQPGARAVLLLAAISMLLVVLHPNQKSRFLHSWIAALWVAADAGIIIAISMLPRGRGVQSLAGVGAVATCLLLVGGNLLAPGRSASMGHRGTEACLLDVTESYLPSLEDSQQTAFLMTLPCKFETQSTYYDRYQRLEGIEFPLLDNPASPADLEAAFDHWLQQTTADTVVLLDFPPESYFYVDVGFDYRIHGRLNDLLAAQTRFVPSEQLLFDRYGCRVVLYRRADLQAEGVAERPDVTVRRL